MVKGKKTKSKNMKLRRRLRKTLGCLFMVSAIIVTAIPVTPIEAADEYGWDTKTTPWCTSKTETKKGGAIPTLTSTNKIYQNEDGTFQFAYVDANGKDDTTSNKNKFAVIVGYNKKQATGGNLTIPNTIDAYIKYMDTGASSFAAASKNGKPLYYKKMKQVTTRIGEDTVLQPDGTSKTEPIYKTGEVFDTFKPCTVEDIDIWCPGGTDIPLYYLTAAGAGIPNNADLTNESVWSMVGSTADDGRIDEAKVSYIGDQFASFNSAGEWKIKGDSTADESVFGGTGEGMAAANITNLSIGTNLLGIGDYAFYNCFNIENINFSDGLNTLGNYAFANCGNLRTVNMPYNAMIDTLGDHAFYNCGKLQSFAMPTVTRVIGDSCFENCTSLKNIELIRKDAAEGEKKSNLQKIGYMAFRNCTSLEKLVLPESYHGAEKVDGTAADLTKNVFHLSTVRGCTSLKYISTPSEKLDFVTDYQSTGSINGSIDGSYGFEAFKTDVGDEFYFEAPGYTSGSNDTIKTKSHNTANVNHIAFKYYGLDKYEIVEKGYDNSTPAKEVGLVYAVNSSGDLIEFRVENADGTPAKVQVPEIIMPEKIGPYGILSIAEGSFSDNCWVQKITIPASVMWIGNNSFKGCHNLKHIIFTDAAKIESINSGAFATQQIRMSAPAHSTGGQDGNSCTKPDADILTGTPSLSFSGAIEKSDGKNTEPFKYAMKSDSNINEGRQPLTYITYYSGLPTNLTVKYNPNTQMSELQGFPTKAEVAGGFVKAGTPDKYIYPYITDKISTEAAGAFGGGTLTENQMNMQNAVYNILIPNGVNSIKPGLFSGIGTTGLTLANTYDTGASTVSGNLPDDGFVSPSPDIQSITTKAVNDIQPYTFARLPELTTAYISGAAAIGDYAFDKCPKLTSAEIGADTMTLGLRPFSGCDALTNVSFPDSTSFSFENGIIFGLENGAKSSIVECLEGRGKIVGSRVVGPDEFAGIKTIAKEAFMDCDSIRTVDLSSTVIAAVPERCFAECDNLNNVMLPNTIRIIDAGSFWNTPGLASVKIPDSISSIANDAFASVPKDPVTGAYGKPEETRDGFDFITPGDSNAAIYAELYDYISVTQDDSLKATYSVYLFDAMDENDVKLITTLQIKEGENLELTAKDAPDHTAEGYKFSKWSPSANIFNPIVADTDIWALYEPMDAITYTVRFFDVNKAEMTKHTQQVEAGKGALAPSKDEMEVEGKVFTGWDRDYSNVTANLDVYAQYSDRTPGTYVVRFWADDAMTQLVGKAQIVKEGEAAIEPAAPKKEGYTFSSWFPSSGWEAVTKDMDIIAMYTQGSGNNGGGNDNNNGNNGNNGGGNNGGGGSGSSASDNSVSGNNKKFTVVVNGGSGSGEYKENESVTIHANAPDEGEVFAGWTSSPAINMVDQRTASTVFRMPAKDVVITANFKKDSKASSVSSNTRNTRRNSTTMVDVAKDGISNTGLASANVNGSSDNYIIKITEDAQATAAVIAALEAKYGDLGNIAYMPMDISLYDSTGQTKITDVSGITVDITLPLPDALIQYAGNNRAASVVNGNQLEELGTKFTTIDGVPCIQFTATHFSPYTIYVDKANLTEGTVDATPKTGDPIHPKWFLAMGFACISIILFCKKEKGQPKAKSA